MDIALDALCQEGSNDPLHTTVVAFGGHQFQLNRPGQWGMQSTPLML